MILLAEFILGILVFFLGACVFSFLNVVIYRVPRKISFVQGRSMCPDCGHILSFRDMIPIVSWLSLGRKCRYCGEPISSRYSIVEFLGGVLACVAFYLKGYSWQALWIFLFWGMLTVVALVDWDTMEIPNGFVIAIGILAVINLFLPQSINWVDGVIGFFAVSVPLLVLTILISGAFGGGDIKLMAVCGLYLGWKLVLISLFFAVLGGGFYGIYLLLTRKKGKSEHFAFGPFLCLGMIVAQIWGEQLLNWYLGFIF